MPMVWAVVLSWNGREETLACLETLARQTRPPDHLLVIDNGSSDGLAAPLAERFPEAAYLRLPENRGFAGGLNEGLRRALEAGADYVLAPNNDTLLDPECLEALLEALEQDPRAAGASPKIYLREKPFLYFNGGGYAPWTLQPLHPGKHRADPRPEETAARETEFLNACCPLYRAAALRKIGLFDERYFSYFEDADLSRRLRRSGWRLLVTPRARVVHAEGLASQRNAGPDLRGTVSARKWYLVTRNHLWFLARHGRLGQKMVGGAWIVLSRILLALGLTARGRMDKARAVLRGLRDGLFAGRG